MPGLTSFEPAPGPRLTVVTATYNRSRALRCAVESVRDQTFTDWEHWVIGDACTDDTPAMLAGLQDPRVRFFNLPRNVGEQSGPNNEGLRRAHGPYVAMLNHDDLWLPDHLELAVRALESSGADLVFSLAHQVEAGGGVVLHNWAPELRYSPELFIPASSWVFRKSLFDRIGGWNPVQAIRNFPSQDWLFRAWKSGADLRLLPLVTAIFLPSRGRDNCYVGNPGAEQEAWLERVRRTPNLRSALTLQAAFPQPVTAKGPVESGRLSIADRLRRARVHYPWKWRRALALKIARWTHGHPTEWEVRLGGGSATGAINKLRRDRGLGKLPTSDP